MSGTLIVRPRTSVRLADNRAFTNRFEIRSETSDRVYVVAQSKTGRWWSCSCFGWIRFRRCKHLEALGLPGRHRPHEARLEG